MPTGIRNRGFASMDAAKQREIARKGGRAAHARGTAHEFSANEARAAGRKGGESVSANRDHMSRIGRIGGKKSAGRRAIERGAAEDGGQTTLPGNEVTATASNPSEATAQASQPESDRQQERSSRNAVEKPEGAEANSAAA